MKRPIFRSFIACLLVMILFMQSGVTVLFLHLTISVSRMERIVSLRADECNDEQIVLDQEEYKRAVNEEGELRFNGEMYDIKEVRYSDDNVILSVSRDTLETKLLHSIFVLSGRNDKKETPPIDFSLCQLMYTGTAPCVEIQCYPDSEEMDVFSSIFSHPVILNSVSPPPEQML